MNPLISATFVLDEEIAKGLGSGELIRLGGVIREAATGRIVTFLRETDATQIQQRLQQAEALLQVGVCR
jgi:hypothetical protein